MESLTSSPLAQQHADFRQDIFDRRLREFSGEAAASRDPVKTLDLIAKHCALHRELAWKENFERITFLSGW